MTKQSFLDEAVMMLRELEEFKRSGSKEAFRKQLGQEYARRLGGAGISEALATAMMSLVPLVRQTRGQSRKRVPDRPSRENPPAKYEIDPKPS
jgi:hypothetical protein